jgi:D-arabinose 1-dehydrogenase-like Zn-dependent alcohol dehydrogenase
MKAVQIDSKGGDLVLVDREMPEPKTGEVLIKVQACGVCHGDAVAKEGTMPGATYPRIPGHEVIGAITKLGAHVANWKIGQRVGVGWHGGHCFKCHACRAGNFWGCENSLVTGLSTDGGYAEYMTAREEALVLIPDELDARSAPLLCAGNTVLGALKSSGAKGGDIVAIHGMGGLGHLAVQFAAKMGFKTVAISRGRDKEGLIRKIGVHEYIDANSADPAKALAAMGGARVILCTAPSGKAISALVPGLSRGGEFIIVAAPNDPLQFHPGLLLGSGRSVKGWAGGSMADALRFAMLVNVMPMVETFPLEQAAEAYQKMMNAEVHFRAVLTME